MRAEQRDEILADRCLLVNGTNDPAYILSIGGVLGALLFQLFEVGL